MRDTKEKWDMLVAQRQSHNQDGADFAEMLWGMIWGMRQGMLWGGQAGGRVGAGDAVEAATEVEMGGLSLTE
ncbi:hypothetical protein CYMTET_17756 [Cymbomonas tetramitiformis]|uniref:Uncharacterized protein n=1 Tax=Cymbomonas tetramitiformis TaxID=36881 RepID=A0AAE0GAT9_9CHLO|nr:hypothetical protein CYMTET_17756 [Cymbomonas tetramitiformis]